MSEPGAPSRSVVLVTSPYSGRTRRMWRHTQKCLEQEGLRALATVDVHNLEALRPWVERAEADGTIIVAAGGDGTVGGVVGYLANTRAAMGILPLGTSNDVARSLHIPMRIAAAVRVLATGKVATIDAGQLVSDGEKPRYFVHAAHMGLNVAFARLATQPSLRRRLGRFTYVVAARRALERQRTFTCTLEFDGRREELRLMDLAIVNAPIFGGPLRLRLAGASVDDRRLDILGVESMPLRRLIPAALGLIVFGRIWSRGVHLYHVRRMRVHVDQPLQVSLDGEVLGRVPGDFVLLGEALRVVVPESFEDVDD